MRAICRKTTPHSEKRNPAKWEILRYGAPAGLVRPTAGPLGGVTAGSLGGRTAGRQDCWASGSFEVEEPWIV